MFSHCRNVTFSLAKENNLQTTHLPNYSLRTFASLLPNELQKHPFSITETKYSHS